MEPLLYEQTILVLPTTCSRVSLLMMNTVRMRMVAMHMVMMIIMIVKIDTPNVVHDYMIT